MEEAKKRFPSDLEYTVALDTTRSINEGISEIVKTLFVALALVIWWSLSSSGMEGNAHSGPCCPGFPDWHLCCPFPSSDSRSIPCRSSAWCWPSGWSSTTPSSSWKPLERHIEERPCLRKRRL